VIKRGLRIFDELSWASGREVLKPTVPFEESPLIHDQNLDPHDAELPAHLKYLVANLDRMRLDAQSTNAEFTVLPYLFLVSDGLKLDVDRNFYLFKYLNDTFYPFSYSFLRKQIDFENLVFKRYDQTFEQPLIELDRLYPQDPNLFNDAVHLNLDGSRLKAWIIFNGLVKMLKGKIDKGELPRPMMHPLQIHPAFPNGAKRTIARVADLEKVCDAKH
jgi:hypothetical protein